MNLNVPDEMGYWGHAANMTGNTWAGVMNGMPWYACGYSFVLWPIFILQSDMSTMYRMTVILNAVLGIMSFLVWLIFYEIISLEEVPKCWKSVLLGVTVGYSYMVHNRMLAVVAAFLLTQIILLYYKKQ